MLAAVAAAVPGKSLKELPNLTINYFDVTGKNLKAINKSIAERQAANAGAAGTTKPGWNLNTSFSKRTTGTQCQIVSANAAFSATLSLPRLVSNAAHSPELLAAWRDYVAGIENMHAATLWSIHDRKGEVEKAVLASSCEGAQGAAAAAVARLKQQAAVQATSVQPQP